MKPSMFDGHGLTIVSATGRAAADCRLAGMKPIPVRKATARMQIEVFRKAGVSNHSCLGQTIWVIVQHCLEQDVPYEVLKYYLNGDVAGGYVVVNTAHEKGA